MELQAVATSLCLKKGGYREFGRGAGRQRAGHLGDRYGGAGCLDRITCGVHSLCPSVAVGPTLAGSSALHPQSPLDML